MTTPPLPGVVPPPPKLSDFMKRTAALPSDTKQAKASGRDPLEIELRRRIVEHGRHLSSLSGLERFCRERFPEWFLRDVRPDHDPVRHGPGYRSGRYACRCLWARFLEDLEK